MKNYYKKIQNMYISDKVNIWKINILISSDKYGSDCSFSFILFHVNNICPLKVP